MTPCIGSLVCESEHLASEEVCLRVCVCVRLPVYVCQQMCVHVRFFTVSVCARSDTTPAKYLVYEPP